MTGGDLGRASHDRVEAWWIGSLALLAGVVLVRPFGDYPLNDDWQYAFIARDFARTGKFVIDPPVAPSLFGQTVLAWPVIRLFGFSHVALRLETLALGVVILWALDALMAIAAVPVRTRVVALFAVAWNPIFLYSACSFMTEFYGYAPCLVGAVIWFRSRGRALPAGVVPLWAAAASGALFGSAFWVRQFCAAVYPALPAATLLALALERRWRDLARSLPPVAAGGVLYAAIVLAFFPWARSTGNLTHQFQGPLANVTHLDANALMAHLGLWVIYMALAFAPLLALAPWRGLRPWALFAVASLFVVVGVVARYMVRDVRMDWLHPTMPFLGNVVEDTGVGPNTLSDVYWYKLPHPRWDPLTWRVVEAIAIHLPALFAPLFVGARRVLRDTRGTLGLEVLAFAVFGSLGTLLLSIQAFKLETLDRYHTPSVLLLPIAIAVAVTALRRERGASELALPVVSRSTAGALVVMAPLAWFAIAGMHDYFRWNDARWLLFRDAVRAGVSPSTIEGGYELDGWAHYDDIRNQRPPTGCIGFCGCSFATWGWIARDCSYHVGMNVLPGYVEQREIPVPYWLAAGPPMRLSRRRN